MAKTLSLVIGIVFLLVGVLGFIPNPIVGEGGLFHTDTVHNLIHLVSGLVFVYVGTKAVSRAATTMKVFGVVYLLIALLGFLTVGEDGTGEILGFIQANSADNWLHVLLGVVILGAGLMVKSNGTMSTPPMGGMNGQPMA